MNDLAAEVCRPAQCRCEYCHIHLLVRPSLETARHGSGFPTSWPDVLQTLNMRSPRERVVKLYSYVVEHDTGRAPNPYFGVCTLCCCKRRKNSASPRNIVELAQVDDWVVGTGGANLRKSAGHGKLVYAMEVDEILTREEYYADPRFAGRWDNLPPKGSFEKRGQKVLVSRHFYYFGAKAINIPKRFLGPPDGLEKKGPGFRSDFAPEVIGRFAEWLENRYQHADIVLAV